MSRNNFTQLAIEFKYDKSERNYTALYRALKKPLLKHIYSFIKDKDIASDIWQDVAIKIFEKIDMYNENFNFSTWVYTIARNECFIWMKSKANKNRVSLSNQNENGIDITTAGEVTVIDSVNYLDVEVSEFDREETDVEYKYTETLDLLAEMDPKYRAFLEDKYIHGLKEKEIATKYGVSKSTVKNRLFHGRKKIQKKYAEKNVSV